MKIKEVDATWPEKEKVFDCFFVSTGFSGFSFDFSFRCLLISHRHCRASSPLAITSTRKYSETEKKQLIYAQTPLGTQDTALVSPPIPNNCVFFLIFLLEIVSFFLSFFSRLFLSILFIPLCLSLIFFIDQKQYAAAVPSSAQCSQTMNPPIDMAFIKLGLTITIGIVFPSPISLFFLIQKLVVVVRLRYAFGVCRIVGNHDSDEREKKKSPPIRLND